LSQINSCDNSIELTNEQVTAALTSLISNDKENRIVGSRKRRRNKSLDRSIEKSNKKSKKISNDIILSNITQPNTIVLATSGLNHQQMVCLLFFFYSFLLFLLKIIFRNKLKNLFYFLIVDYYYWIINRYLIIQ